MITTGDVRGDGSSAVAEAAGLYDMAALGDAAVVTPAVEESLKRLYAAELELAARATFKLEVFFKHGPRHNCNVRGILAAWTNGGFTGGSDQTVYFCPHPRLSGTGTCLAPIDIQFCDGSVVVCTECMRKTRPRELVGQLIAELPMQGWADLITQFFYRMNCSADVLTAVSRHSLLEAAEKEKERDRGGAVYASVYAGREWVTYPLASIIKDTGNGSALNSRIKAFLEA